MSGLIDKIDKLYTNGVEVRTLDDVFNMFGGMTGVSQKWAESGNCQFIDYMNAYNNISIDVTALRCATVKNINQNSLKKGDILFTAASETPDECAIAAEIECDIVNNVFMDDHLFGLRLKENYHNVFFTGYLKYWFRSSLFRKMVNKTVRGVTRFYISKTDFMKLLIPIPPLEVQREIVRVLDSFTLLTAELTAKLTAELTARKKQYEFYRERITSFDQNTPTKRLRDIIDFRNGKGHEKDIVSNGKYIVVNSKFISTNGEVKKYSYSQICPLYKDDILMVMSDLPNGRALAKCFLVEEDDKYSLNQRIGAFHVKDETVVKTKFLIRILNRNSQLLRFDNGVDQTNLRKDDILNILIPVPDIRTQDKIIYELEKFESNCFDLYAGLPAEIDARQKQYEYYRDKLLSFKELGA